MCSSLGLVSFVKSPQTWSPLPFGIHRSTNSLSEDVCIPLFGLINRDRIPTTLCGHYWLFGYLHGVTVMS